MSRSTFNLWREPFVIAAVLFALVLGVFLPCLRNGFSNFDDPVYILWNPHVHSGLSWKAIRWAFTSFYAANWHPLTWISHMIDVQLFDGRPWGHHLTNVLFHSANVALLFLFLNKATGSVWRSSLVAILFGFHPLHVESVAWIAERKDVLNAFFSLLTLLAYVHWTQTNKPGRSASIWYLIALLCFALSLGSKAMSVPLPVLLLLLDYWPLKRLDSSRAVRWAFVEKISLLILAAAASTLTIAAQSSGGAIKVTVPLWVRAANSILSFAQYLWKLIWPHDLAVFYPYTVPTVASILFSLLFFIAISTAVIFLRRTFPWLFVGWWWFVISLLPVIGIIQIGTQAMADRYMYWPSIGPLIALVWSAADFCRKIQLSRPILASATCLLVTVFAALTERQISFWKNSETLFHHALVVTDNNPTANLNLGVALADRGATAEALFYLREAVRIAPLYPDAHLNLGMALHENGILPEAISEFETAIQLKPDYAKAYVNLAVARQEENDLERAIDAYRAALRLDPSSPEVRVGFGLALQRSGQIDAALDQFEEAIKEDPAYAGAHSNRGIVLEKLDRLQEAISEYRKALSLDPKNADASLNLPVVLFKTGQVDEAVTKVKELIKQRPDYAEAYFNLGGMLYSKSDFDGAVSAYRHALELRPDYADAQHNLDVVLEEKAAAKR